MDDNEDFIRLGEQLLEEHMEGTLSSDIFGNSSKAPSFQSDSNSSTTADLPQYDKLYAKCILLNKLFKKNGITSFDQPITESFKEIIKSEVRTLLKILEIEGKKPEIIETRNYSSTLEDALNILSFSLLLLQNNNTEANTSNNFQSIENENLNNSDNSNDSLNKSALFDQMLESRSQEIIETEKLKNENLQLRKRIFQCNYFFKSLAKQLKLPENSSLSAIISQVSLMDLPINSIEDKYQIDSSNNLRSALIEQLKLKSDSSDDEIISQIKTFQNESCNSSLRQFCIEMFDLPKDSDENDIKIKLSTIVGKLAEVDYSNPTSAKPNSGDPEELFLSSEFKSLKSKLDAADHQIRELKDKNKLLKKLTKESVAESKSKTSMIEDLNQKINELSLQNENLSKQLKEEKRLTDKYSSNSIKASQLDKNYSKAFNDLSIQLENQSTELSRISQNRNNLFEIINLQKQLIEMLDKNEFYSKKKELIQDQFIVNKNLQILSDRLIQISKDNKRNDLIDKLSDNTDLYPQSDDVIINKITSLYSHIIKNEVKQDVTPKKLTTKNENLVSFESYQEICEYVSSLLLFFDKLANSPATLILLTDLDEQSNIKDTLSRYVQRITFFLQERQIDFVAPEFLSIPDTIFTALKKNPSKSNIQEFQMMQQHRVFVVLTVADILKNYSSKLEQRISQLEMDIRSLKNELKISGNQLNDSKSSNEEKPSDLVELVDTTTQKSFSEDEINNEEEQLTDFNNSEKFCCCNRNNQNESSKNAIKQIKKKYDKLIREQEKAIDEISNQLVETEKLINNEKEKNIKLENNNKELADTLSIMTKRLSQIEIEKDNAVIAKGSEVAKEYEAKLDAQKQIIKKLNDKIEEIKQNAENEQETQSNENDELQAENRELFAKMDKMRSKYEGLIKTYKEKYDESTANESRLAEEVAKQKDNLKKISQELNEARIELKMQTLRNKSLAEKVEREIALYQTKMSAMSSNYEMSLNEKIQFNELEYESRRRKFLVRLFETLRDFVDFSQKMTEDNCIRIISKLVEKVKLIQTKEKEFGQLTRLINEMKSILNVENNNDLLTKVMLLSTKSDSDTIDADQESSKNSELATNLASIELKLKQWHQWANCMNSMLSDNFSSNTPLELASESTTADAELRSRIEEKLLSSIGNRKIFRQIEILRTEKILLNKQLSEYQANSKAQNQSKAGLRQLISISLAINRIQKLSGRLPSSTLGLSQAFNSYSILNDKNNELTPIQDSTKQEYPKRRPIISYT